MTSQQISLNQFAANLKRSVLTDLLAGKNPPGEYDPVVLQAAQTKGKPQMGTTRYEPMELVLEFVFPDPQTSPTILEVRIPAPERIVYLPVPAWVVESIWEGEIDGSYHFESDANAMVEALVASMKSDTNAGLFGTRHTTGRRV